MIKWVKYSEYSRKRRLHETKRKCIKNNLFFYKYSLQIICVDFENCQKCTK